MKRNILLGFLLIGLVIAEWGCVGWGGNCDPVPDDNYLIVGFDQVEMSSYQNTILTDSVRFDTLKFNFYTQTERVGTAGVNKIFQNGLFATEPCPPAAEVVITKFDSIKILTFLNGKFQDITNHFAINAQTSISNGMYSYEWVPFKKEEALSYLNSIKNYRSPNLILGIVSSLGDRVNSPITFQFFDTEGNIFETTTEPIVITP